MTTRRRFLIVAVWFFIILVNLAHRDMHALLAGLMAGLGAAVALELTELWRLLFARIVGHTVLGLSIGSGRKLAQWQIGGMPVGLRWFLATPLMAETVLTRRPAHKVRLWVSTLLLSGVQLGLGGWLMTHGSGLVPYLGGGELLIFGVALTFMARLPLTPGWILFRLPFLPADALDAYALTPAEVAAVRALRRGRVSEARAALGDSASRYRSHLIRAMIAIAEGRYADASTDSLHAVESAPHHRFTAPAYFLRAAALVGAAETGELPPAEYRPWLAQAVDAGRSAHPVLARYVSGPADVALLEGRPDDALKLARAAARFGLDPFCQANAECTYAAALAANGRPDEARAALERARKLMPELARIGTVAARIGSAEVTEVR